MSSVVIVDYKLGNLYSLERALHRVGSEAVISDDPDVIRNAELLILPGVGAFGDGMANLKAKSLDVAIRDYASAGKPLLGICLGMQLLMSESEEFGKHEGLDLISGRVIRFQDPSGDSARYKIPNVGWCTLDPSEAFKSWEGTILGDVCEGDSMYFVHSFKVVPASDEHCLAMTDYAEGPYCSVVKKDQIYGCQFHPEKSGEIGLSILKKFVSLGQSQETSTVS